MYIHTRHIYVCTYVCVYAGGYICVYIHINMVARAMYGWRWHT